MSGSQKMSTSFQIPRVLQQYCNHVPELHLEGSTVKDLLDDVERRYPVLYRCICDETGAVRPHIHLFVNNEILGDRHGRDTELTTDDVVSVFQAVSGG